MSARDNRFGLVIVGDELLSGKRRDGHFDFMVDTLKKRGAELAWVRLIGDDPEIQAETYRQTRAGGLRVFSFGGIGATPDDLTRQAAATAFGRKLVLHPEGMEILRDRFGEELTDVRCQLVCFPAGSSLIPNPVNRIPGFSLENHHFLPGFPNMAWPMVEWVLQHLYADEKAQASPLEFSLRCEGVYESELIPLMQQLIDRYPEVKVSCLPASNLDRQAELGVRGTSDEAAVAFGALCELLEQQGIRFLPLNPPN